MVGVSITFVFASGSFTSAAEDVTCFLADRQAGSQLTPPPHGGATSAAGSDGSDVTSGGASVITKVTKEVDESLGKASEKLERAGSTISELFGKFPTLPMLCLGY